MGTVEFRLGGRSHSVQCGDGEEARLRHLVTYLDAKYQEIEGQHGQMPDSKALVLISLMVADELSDAYDEINRIKREGDGGHAGHGDAEAAAALDRVASRIEQLASAIENA
jgi:cell division protein ZapA